MRWAKDNNNKLVYPSASEFAGIPNWEYHDYQLRKRGYKPLVGEAEPREGYTAVPATWHEVGDGLTAYIQVDSWNYVPIPIPEPVLPRQFSKGALLEALIGCGLYEVAKAIYAEDLDLQIAWAGFSSIDMDYQATKDIMDQYPALFTPENILGLQRYIAEHSA